MLQKQQAELAVKSFWRDQRTFFQKGSLVAEGKKEKILRINGT
jgi:hypothetical protein